MAAFFDVFKISSVGFQWEHGVLDSGYFVFIARILDNFPSSFIDERSQDFFFFNKTKESLQLCITMRDY